MTDVTAQARARRRLFLVGAIVVVAIVAVAVVIAVSSGGGSGPTTASTTAGAPAAAGPGGLKGVSAVTSEFAGIPQSGNRLGSASAPATMMVFADMQCPFCAEFENGAMPALVKRYVRPGKLKIVFQPIAILGTDSVLGARAAASAAQQNKLFEYAGILYRNQGDEGSGYLNDAYVKKIGAATPGLDVAKLTAGLKSAPVNKLLNDAQSIATSGKVQSTPSFFVARSGQPLEQLPVTSLTADAFYAKLDSVTG